MSRSSDSLPTTCLTVQFYEYVVNNQGKFKTLSSPPICTQARPNWQGEDWVKSTAATNWRTPCPARRSRRLRRNALPASRCSARRPRAKSTARPSSATRTTSTRPTSAGRTTRPVGSASSSRATSCSGIRCRAITTSSAPSATGTTRSGASVGRIDTTYQIIPLARGRRLRHPRAAGVLRLRPQVDPVKIKDDPERFLYCPQTLKEWAENYCGEERVKFWLEKQDGQRQQQAAPAHPAASNGGHGAAVSTSSTRTRRTTRHPTRRRQRPRQRPTSPRCVPAWNATPDPLP